MRGAKGRRRPDFKFCHDVLLADETQPRVLIQWIVVWESKWVYNMCTCDDVHARTRRAPLPGHQKAARAAEELIIVHALLGETKP